MDARFETTVTLGCERCRAHFDVTLGEVLDTRQSPDLCQKLVEGTLNIVTCPACGNRRFMGMPFVYHNPDTKMFVLCLGLAGLKGESERRAAIEHLMKRFLGVQPREVIAQDYVSHPEIIVNPKELYDRVRPPKQDPPADEQPRWLQILGPLLGKSPEEIDRGLDEAGGDIDAEFLDHVVKAGALKNPHDSLRVLAVAERASLRLDAPRLRAACRLNQGQALLAIRKPEEALAALTEALAFYEGSDERSQLAYCLSRIGLCCEDLERWPEAVTALTRSAAIYGELGDRRFQALQIGSAGGIQEKQEDFDGAIESYGRTIDLVAGTLADIEGLYRAKRGRLQIRRGQPAAALPDLERAATLFHQLGDVSQEGQAHVARARALGALDRAREGVDVIEAALRDLVKAKRWPDVADAADDAVQLLVALNDAKGALDKKALSVQAVQQFGKPREWVLEVFKMGRLARALGDTEEAVRCFEMARQGFTALHDPDGAANADYDIGITHLAADHVDAARTAFQAAADAWAPLDPAKHATALGMVAQAMAKGGAGAEAERILREVAPQQTGVASVSTHVRLAHIAREAGRLNEASEHLAAAARACPENSAAAAGILLEQARVDRLQGKTADYIRALEQALAVLQQFEASDAVAAIASELALHFEERGDLRRARALLDTAIERIAAPGGASAQVKRAFESTDVQIHSELPDVSRLEVASFGRLVSLSLKLGDPRAALVAAQAGLTAARKAGDRKGEAVLSTLCQSLGWRYGDVKSDESLAAAEQAVDLARELGEPTLFLQALRSRSEARRLHGDLDGAEQDAIECLSLTEPQGQTLDRALALGSMALVHRWRGRFDQAIDCLEQAAAIARRAGADAIETDQLSALGLVQTEVGQWQDALSTFGRALDVAQAAHNLYGTASVLGNRGNLFYQLDNLDEAEHDHEQALQLDERLGDRVSAAHANGNLGLVHWRRGDLDKARQYMLRSLATHRELGMVRDVALDLGNLGNLLINDDPAGARSAFEESLEMHRGIDNRPGQALMHLNLASVNLVSGTAPEAWEHANRSVTLMEDVGVSGEIARALYTRSLAAERIGRSADALADATRAVNAEERSRLEVLVPEYRRSLSGRDAYLALDRRILLGLGSDTSRETLSFVERAKARTLSEQLRSVDLPVPAGAPADLVTREKALVSNLGQLVARRGSASGAQRAQLDQELDRVGAELGKVWNALAPSAPGYVALRRGEAAPADALMQALDTSDRVALIEFHASKDELLAWYSVGRMTR